MTIFTRQMQHWFKIVLLGIVLLGVNHGFSQSMYRENDSLVFFWKPNYDSIPHQNLKPMNLQLDSIDAVNTQPYNWLDNPEHKLLPFKNYKFDQQEWYSKYDQLAEGIGYYYARSPYVSAFYSFGSRQNQTLRLFHTQNFGKNFNYAIRYNRDQSLGFMRNNVVNDNNVSLSLHSEIPRWQFRLKATYFQKTTNESGGLNDPDTSLTGQRSLELIPVNISSSEKKAKGFFASWDQRIFFDTTNKGWFYFCNHDIYSNAHTYVESGSSVTNFYDNVYFDSTETGFTQKFNSTSHTIGVGQQFPKFSWLATTYFRYSEYSQHELLRIQRNYWVKGGFNYNGDKIDWGADGRIAYLGTQQGNFKVKGHFYYTDTSYQLKINARLSSLDPYLEHQYMNANNFQWNQSLSSVQKFWVDIQNNLWGEKLMIGLGYVAAKDEVYFSTNSPELRPEIYNETAHLIYLSLGTHLKFWKIHWIANVKGQYSRDLEVFNYPLLDASTRLYFDGAVFKSKKLRIQTGLDLHYYSGVNNFGYMPFLDEYYYRPGYQDVGNVFYFDYFLNFKVSSVDVFAKLYHWNAGWMQSQPVYLAHQYPVSPLHFRVGLRWQFLN